MVLAILMVIVGIALPRFSSAVVYTQYQADMANRVLIEGAVDLYKMDTGMVPECIEDLLNPPSGVKGWRGPYLEQMPTHPREGKTYELDDKGKLRP